MLLRRLSATTLCKYLFASVIGLGYNNVFNNVFIISKAHYTSKKRYLRFYWCRGSDMFDKTSKIFYI